MKHWEQINKDNKKWYKLYGTCMKGNCVICGKLTTADDSYSNGGDRFTCWSCMHKISWYNGQTFLETLNMIHADKSVNRHRKEQKWTNSQE